MPLATAVYGGHLEIDQWHRYPGPPFLRLAPLPKVRCASSTSLKSRCALAVTAVTWLHSLWSTRLCCCRPVGESILGYVLAYLYTLAKNPRRMIGPYVTARKTNAVRFNEHSSSTQMFNEAMAMVHRTLRAPCLKDSSALSCGPAVV